ncbi:MAG: peptide ligase PGM1-related protein [Actinomycetota bacterium]
MDDLRGRFEALQAKLAPFWKTMADAGPQTVVVVPSISYDDSILGKLQGLRYYEERFLILLMLLRDPRARLIYVTSQPILPNVVDYYLHLLPGVIPSQAAKRLFLISASDSTQRPLTLKLLERPRLLSRIRELIVDPDRSYLIPFNTTGMELELAVSLGTPLYGADPALTFLGTKSGGRRLFAQHGVPYPAGFEDLTSMGEIAKAISALRSGNPSLQHALVKTNGGVSGFGNALIDLGALPVPGDPGESAAITSALRHRLGDSYQRFTANVAAEGAVVEERVTGRKVRSPSAQLQISPLGEVQLLSTHDQVLGGADGQVYEGCSFPADEAYAVGIAREAEKVGRALAAKGVVGRASMDFIVVLGEQGWEPYGIELNLRQGGTTHPFLTLQFLTDGRYVAAQAAFIAPNGRRKFFVASDHVESESYRGLSSEDLFDLSVKHRLHFDHAQQTGSVFHMVGALPEIGRTGLTTVADSPEEAQWMFDRVVDALDEEAEGAYLPRSHPDVP